MNGSERFAQSSDRIEVTQPEQLLEWSRIHLAHAQRAGEQADTFRAGHTQALSTPGLGGEGFDEMVSFLNTYAQYLRHYSDRKARLSMAVASCWTNYHAANQTSTDLFTANPNASKNQ